MRLILILAMFLVGCGKEIQVVETSSGVSKTSSLSISVPISLTLNADLGHHNEVTLPQSVSLSFPISLAAYGEMTVSRQAILHLGDSYCLYVASAGDQQYSRINGSCNSDPSHAVGLITGDTVSLEVVWSSGTGYTGAIAEVK